MTWKVPEEFRDKASLEFGLPGEPFGAFKCKSPTRKGHFLHIIASPGGDIGNGRIVNWEHVSVHTVVNLIGTGKNLIPTWDEMDYVKSLFWDNTDVVMQLHISDERKIDFHKYTLHLWRPTDREIPLPDKDLV